MFVSEGSSPQVRGIFLPSRHATTILRIIPAGAGHLSQRASFIGFIGDHPRRCGAFGLYGFIEVDCEGSSPQVRGI